MHRLVYWMDFIYNQCSWINRKPAHCILIHCQSKDSHPSLLLQHTTLLLKVVLASRKHCEKKKKKNTIHKRTITHSEHITMHLGVSSRTGEAREKQNKLTRLPLAMKHNKHNTMWLCNKYWYRQAGNNSQIRALILTNQITASLTDSWLCKKKKHL